MTAGGGVLPPIFVQVGQFQCNPPVKPSVKHPSRFGRISGRDRQNLETCLDTFPKMGNG